uniref:Trichocyst matrix protein T2-A n=1 Tax=Philasterides dicentrarchi TaxID=282688 RepID=A0A2Z4NAH0_9CILI|nr:trichocyst matrix protein T2-A [Philasterides dicentrarchi]QEE82883.1 trichocyst matrix protein T2-A [Philasterides dicentrarchi]
MRVLTALFACVLVLGAFAVTDPEIASVVRKMENSKYGKTLLDTIALQMEAGDPVQDLIDMLQETEDGLERAQDEDDEFIRNEQERCDVDLARLQGEIEDAARRIAELQAELDEKIPIRDEKVRVLGEKNEWKDHLEAKVAEIDSQKVLKDQEWAEEQEQHDQAQYVIEKAKTIIVEALKANSFLQKGNTAFAQVSSHFAKHSKTHFKRQSWSKIFNLLSQITSSAPVQADQGSVQKVIDLCDSLLDKISESREIERRDYQHWMEEYKNFRNQLLDKLVQVNKEIADLEQQIAALNKRIAQCQAEKADQEERFRQKTSEHEDLLQYCDDANVAYAKRRESRNDEREVVSDAIGLLQSKLRTFRQYVSERMGSDVKRAD